MKETRGGIKTEKEGGACNIFHHFWTKSKRNYKLPFLTSAVSMFHFWSAQHAFHGALTIDHNSSRRIVGRKTYSPGIVPIVEHDSILTVVPDFSKYTINIDRRH